MATSAAAGPTGRRVRTRPIWWVMAAAAIGVAIVAVPPYLGFDAAFSTIPTDPNQPLHIVWLSLHAITGGLAMVTGPFQFLTALRRRRPRVHRALGRVYVGAVAAGAVMALLSALVTTSGRVAQAGLLFLVVLWSYSLVRAFQAIRAGQIQLHRIWMIRNYALTFAAVALRAILVVGVLVRAVDPGAITFPQVYDIAVWGSFTLTLVVAEWFIVQTTLAPLARATQRQEAA
ncbi:MAG: DUF2306 domain-containing protein [Pseudonocardia sp.]